MRASARKTRHRGGQEHEPPPTHPHPHPTPMRARARAEGAAGGGFRYFWLTDSNPEISKALSTIRPFEILSLAAPIAAALQI